MALRARGIVQTMDAPKPPSKLPDLPSNVGRAIDLLAIHCSATQSGKWLGGAPGTVGRKSAAAVIDGWHAQRGFCRVPAARSAFNWQLAAIGYHYVVDLDGTVLTGRSLSEVGAHAAGFNANSVGICMVGGIEAQAQYTAPQWAALRDLVQQLSNRFGVPLQRPVRTPLKTAPGFRAAHGVCGHRDLSPDLNRDGAITRNEWLKTCPGFDVSAWLAGGMQPMAGQVAL